MNEWNIGANIAVLRKEKGVTQEALAEFVGVTGQAVSKWESGGSPDTPLLPVIADYFEVSIDRLFGRKVTDYKDLKMEVAEFINSIPEKEDRLRMVFDFCWFMEIAIMRKVDEKDDMIDDLNDQFCSTHSQMIFNNGATSFGINEVLRYFLIMPEPEKGWGQRLHYKKEYTQLFAMLADEDVLKALFFLYGRNSKSFTPRLLEREFGFSITQAEEILGKLTEYGLVWSREIELDDEMRTVYDFNSFFSFVPFLTFAEEIIQRPKAFYCNWVDRQNPWLR